MMNTVKIVPRSVNNVPIAVCGALVTCDRLLDGKLHIYPFTRYSDEDGSKTQKRKLQNSALNPSGPKIPNFQTT